MNVMQKIISAGFATCALASASMPALSWTVWPDVDFEWYANVGKPVAPAAAQVDVFPAPREGFIWAPGRYERTASGNHQWVPGQWVRDDYEQQVAVYSTHGRTTYATGPLTLLDRDGNAIPTQPEAYPVDSIRR